MRPETCDAPLQIRVDASRKVMLCRRRTVVGQNRVVEAELSCMIAEERREQVDRIDAGSNERFPQRDHPLRPWCECGSGRRAGPDSAQAGVSLPDYARVL